MVLGRRVGVSSRLLFRKPRTIHHPLLLHCLEKSCLSYARCFFHGHIKSRRTLWPWMFDIAFEALELSGFQLRELVRVAARILPITLIPGRHVVRS